MPPGAKPPRWHRQTVGFVIYRCVYENDTDWDRFMDLLTASAQAALDEDPCGPQLKEKFAWQVENNKTELDGASKDEVRRRFNAWVASIDGPTDNTRYSNCIYVDQEVVDSVLCGGDSTHFNGELQPTAFVKILNHEFTDQPRVWTADELPNDEDREAVNTAYAADEGYELVEGCSRRDVGWMKYEAKRLIPRAFSLLMNYGWDSTYLRPPQIQSV